MNLNNKSDWWALKTHVCEERMCCFSSVSKPELSNRTELSNVRIKLQQNIISNLEKELQIAKNSVIDLQKNNTLLKNENTILSNKIKDLESKKPNEKNKWIQTNCFNGLPYLRKKITSDNDSASTTAVCGNY